MALITTTVALGWYGMEDETECVALSLPQLIGTYDNNGNFVKGTSNMTEQNAKNVHVYSFTSMGSTDVWNLLMEKDYRASNPEFISMDTLDCGRMYYFIKETDAELNIPHFVPSANGVDVGRVA